MIYVVKDDVTGKYYDVDRGRQSRCAGTLWESLAAAEAIASDIGNAHAVPLVETPAPVEVSVEEAEVLKKAKRVSYPAAKISGETDGHDDEDRLMRAYVNGWEVEKPKRWNVKVPHATNSYYYDMGWGNGLETQDMKAGTQPLPGFREAQFTQDEINKRGLQDCTPVEVTDDEQ